MQNILGGDRLLADAAFGEGEILGDRRVEMMAHHQHVEMLVDRVPGEGPRRIGRRRQHVLEARDLDDVRRMAAAGAFGVEGVDGAALERLDRVLDEAGFVERVGVDHHLHVVIVGDRQAAIDRGRRRAPILVQLQRAGAGLDHLLERRRPRGIALAGEAEIDRKRVGGLDHARDVPRARRAGGGVGAVRRAGAAAEHRGDARHQRLVDLLRADEMDMRVEAAGGEDLAFAGDDLGARPDDDGHARLDVGIAGLADGEDLAVLDADIGLDDAPMVENQRIGDDGVDRALPVGDLRLAHAVADHLAAAEFHLLAVDGEILLHLDDEIGVGEPHAVAGGRAEHVGIDVAADLGRHDEASEFAHDVLAEAVDDALAGERDERDRRASGPARSAPRCRRRCRAACRAPSCGRISAPDWSRRNDSASRPGSAGRRYWRPRASRSCGPC